MPAADFSDGPQNAANPGAPTIAPLERLYPSLEPFAQGAMDTGDGHRIYFEQCGNPQGLPVVVLHGGPAGGCSPLQRRFFDPAVFRIVLFDQRGCGRSTPRGSLENNDTAALLRDIEQLRRQLGIQRWIVFGGSWGASLAIAYAADHLSSCQGVILRGTFLTGSRDLDWFFGGAGALLPADWQRLLGRIGLALPLDQCEHAGHVVLATLKRQLFCEDPVAAGTAALAWARWEDAVSRPGGGGTRGPATDPAGHRAGDQAAGPAADPAEDQAYDRAAGRSPAAAAAARRRAGAGAAGRIASRRRMRIWSTSIGCRRITWTISASWARRCCWEWPAGCVRYRYKSCTVAWTGFAGLSTAGWCTRQSREAR